MGSKSRAKQASRHPSPQEGELLPQSPSQGANQVTTTHTMAARSGPIPGPHEMKGYQEVRPDIVDFILKQAEEEARTRRAHEGIVVDAQVRDNGASADALKRSQDYGFRLGLGVLVLSGVIAFAAESDVQRIIGTIGAPVSLATLIWGPGSRSRVKEDA